jgi:DNA repair and recombination protein RAD54 and RAD54-like protein
VSHADLRSKGEQQCNHDCILDEKLGLTCRSCGTVCIEAKHMFPPMVTPT